MTGPLDPKEEKIIDTAIHAETEEEFRLASLAAGATPTLREIFMRPGSHIIGSPGGFVDTANPVRSLNIEYLANGVKINGGFVAYGDVPNLKEALELIK